MVATSLLVVDWWFDTGWQCPRLNRASIVMFKTGKGTDFGDSDRVRWNCKTCRRPLVGPTTIDHEWWHQHWTWSTGHDFTWPRITNFKGGHLEKSEKLASASSPAPPTHSEAAKCPHPLTLHPAFSGRWLLNSWMASSYVSWEQWWWWEMIVENKWRAGSVLTNNNEGEKHQ